LKEGQQKIKAIEKAVLVLERRSRARIRGMILQKRDPVAYEILRNSIDEYHHRVGLDTVEAWQWFILARHFIEDSVAPGKVVIAGAEPAPREKIREEYWREGYVIRRREAEERERRLYGETLSIVVDNARIALEAIKAEEVDLARRQEEAERTRLAELAKSEAERIEEIRVAREARLEAERQERRRVREALLRQQLQDDEASNRGKLLQEELDAWKNAIDEDRRGRLRADRDALIRRELEADEKRRTNRRQDQERRLLELESDTASANVEQIEAKQRRRLLEEYLANAQRAQASEKRRQAWEQQLVEQRRGLEQESTNGAASVEYSEAKHRRRLTEEFTLGAQRAAAAEKRRIAAEQLSAEEAKWRRFRQAGTQFPPPRISEAELVDVLDGPDGKGTPEEQETVRRAQTEAAERARRQQLRASFMSALPKNRTGPGPMAANSSEIAEKRTREEQERERTRLKASQTRNRELAVQRMERRRESVSKSAERSKHAEAETMRLQTLNPTSHIAVYLQQQSNQANDPAQQEALEQRRREKAAKA
jgi:hypothetical protein